MSMIVDDMFIGMFDAKRGITQPDLSPGLFRLVQEVFVRRFQK